MSRQRPNVTCLLSVSNIQVQAFTDRDLGIKTRPSQISPLADLGGARPARAPHLPGILVFDDILGHIV